MKINQVPHKILATSLLGTKEEPWVDGNIIYLYWEVWVEENREFRKVGLGGPKYKI